MLPKHYTVLRSEDLRMQGCCLLWPNLHRHDRNHRKDSPQLPQPHYSVDWADFLDWQYALSHLKEIGGIELKGEGSSCRMTPRLVRRQSKLSVGRSDFKRLTPLGDVDVFVHVLPKNGSQSRGVFGFAVDEECLAKAPLLC